MGAFRCLSCGYSEPIPKVTARAWLKACPDCGGANIQVIEEKKVGLLRRLFGGKKDRRGQPDSSISSGMRVELEREIVGLATSGLAKLSQLAAGQLKYTLESSFSADVVSAFVQTQAQRALIETRPINDYISFPQAHFGLCMTLFPGSRERARKYYLDLYPSFGFAGFMLKAISDHEDLMEMESTWRDKKGVLFLFIALPPEAKKAFVTFGLCPISKDFADSVPFVSPIELVPPDINATLGGPH